MSLRAWLARAASEQGQPSSKRVTFMWGLCVVAPSLLVGALLKAPAAFPEAFTAYVIAVGGAYTVSRFAEWKGNKPPAPPTV